MGKYSHGVRLTIAYDGAEFRGWQVQPGQRTVQGVLNEALGKMETPNSGIRGASRTDSGVHAEGNCAAFGCSREIDGRGWRLALNGLLPRDVAIVHADEVPPKYDPRHDSTGKHYRYQLCTGLNRDPLSRDRAWYLGPAFARRDIRPRTEIAADYLDIDAMREAANAMLGTRDFKSFQAANDYRKDATRTLNDIEIIPAFGGKEKIVAIEVHGTAFVKNMVRIIAGTLVEVGRQRIMPNEIEGILEGRNRRLAGPTAPAHGLTLMKVHLGRIDMIKAAKRAALKKNKT